jgi:DcuC family C4-dicarboxylate transporter
MDTDGQREARLASQNSEPDEPHSQLNSSHIDSGSSRHEPVGISGLSLVTERLIVFGALLLSQAIVQYWPNPLLLTTRGLLSFAAWALGLFGADRTSVLISVALVALGSGIFASLGTGPLTALVSFGENSGILLIMVLVPLVGIVIERGGYADALGEISQGIRQPAHLFGVALVLAHATGSVLLNASISLLWTVLAPIVVRMGKRPEDVLVPSLPRGYTASLLWTPSSVAMAIVLILTGASWTSVAGPGFVTSLCALALAILVEAGGPALTPDKHRDTVRLTSHRPQPAAWRKALGLAFGLGSFIAGVVILQELGLSVFQAIIPCVALTLVIWGGLIGKSGDVWKSVFRYFSKELPGLSSQFLLMTTAGFIGAALQSALKDGLPGVSLTVQLDPLVLTLVASLLVWVIAIAGIHSLIGMTIVHSVMAPFAKGVSPAHWSLTLLLGAALGFTISPVSATMLLTSAAAGKNTIEVGLRRQWKYVAVSWVVCSVVLTLLRI